MSARGKSKWERMRSAERYSTQGLRTAEGEIKDMSKTGMRVAFAGRPPFRQGDVREFGLRSAGKQIKVTGRVAWVRRSSLFNKDFSAGVQFVNVPEHVSRGLAAIAEHGFIPDPKQATIAGGGQASEQPASNRVRVQVIDLYDILGVDDRASTEQIHEAYRKLAKTTHPDISDEPDAAEKFELISKAFRVLKDDEARKGYDNMRRGAA